MPLLQVKGMTKRFPGVLALDTVDFEVETGEIRALLGENGAGKSTLIKLLTGVETPDQGTVLLADQEIRPRSPAHAQHLGVSTVYQEVNLVPNLTVAENIGLRDGGPIIRWKEMRKRAKAALQRLNLNIDVDKPLGDLPLAIQQLVAIARAIDREAKVLILDEPTSSLDRQEADQLFATMRHLREEGMAIIFVTHFLDQVYAVADTITILRNGQKVGDWKTQDLTHNDLIRHMIGQSLEALDLVEGPPPTGEPIIRARSLGRRRMLEPLDLDIRRGEVLGLSGLLGSGRTETINLLYGAIPADSGTINDARPPKSPAPSVQKGWGLCPEDRKVDGIFPGLSIRENIAIVQQTRRGWLRRIPTAELDQTCDEMIKTLNIKTPNAEKPIDQLSGGNQQKTILARWLAAKPECLFLDEPTRGIDVGAKLEVRRLVRNLAEDGMAFVFTSSELEEIAGTCDRVAILRDRRKVGDLEGKDITEDAIMDRISEAHP